MEEIPIPILVYFGFLGDMIELGGLREAFMAKLDI
jgi:hypothetical protein